MFFLQTHILLHFYLDHLHVIILTSYLSHYTPGLIQVGSQVCWPHTMILLDYPLFSVKIRNLRHFLTYWIFGKSVSVRVHSILYIFII